MIDAVRSGARPARCTASTPAPSRCRPRWRIASTHALGLAEAIELARALDRLPARLELYGIEGARFEAGAGLTPAVAPAVEALCGELCERLAGALRPM